MSGTSDLGPLLALRALREERARTAVSVAVARLRNASRLVLEAEAAIEDHDREADQQEQRFFKALQIKPLPSGDLGRRHDLLGISDQRRDALSDRRNEAAEEVADCERQLAALQTEWRQRLVERDKLAEAQSQLRDEDRARVEAVAEQEAEEMSADRARVVC